MKKVLPIIIILLILTSCQSAKDAFSLQKRNSTDEFLVEKKSPLVLPPSYGELPMPNDSELNKDKSEEVEDVELLINNDQKTLSTKVEKKTNPTSIEKSILEKIK
tara:strand:+ start:468 stop:782 length:315 start_codon:yes stop_codon:yes gene_type:complete